MLFTNYLVIENLLFTIYDFIENLLFTVYDVHAQDAVIRLRPCVIDTTTTEAT